jgi:hypothetical protein
MPVKKWRGMTSIDRFKTYFKEGKPNECWNWLGDLRIGYGRIYWNGSLKSAHRVSWEISNKKKIKDGYKICHTCDNRACVNPKHLFEATQAENIRDMDKKGRRVKVLGTKVNTARLNESNVRKIRKMLSDGKTRYYIAKKFNVGWSTVSAIYKGKSWAWLD